jgi:hypothetical protein
MTIPLSYHLPFRGINVAYSSAHLLKAPFGSKMGSKTSMQYFCVSTPPVICLTVHQSQWVAAVCVTKALMGL